VHSPHVAIINLIGSYFLVIYEGISTELFRIFFDPVIGGVSKGYRRCIEEIHCEI